ncbi:type IV toxin-antitoxin system AbiEi family antitoxin domain-containing protein [Baekduia sp.]|uniref:type IV toxin-antitoxin system AbiEi family antitoxin domain-containing protein n=1 Tax=Baekduia sp. TaxID=2600305 RepID=UPI002D1FB957|nr:type IV toxin-antitoxin system AbiEi family antitoxin [Baekduia sp.]
MVLHRALSGPFTAEDAAAVLEVPRAEAARIAGYLASKGWLSRVRRGLFTVVPLEAEVPEAWRADPWLVAARVFAPCYIGGWSACEHWGLTEQLFRSVLVVSATPQRRARVAVQGTEFRVVTRRPEVLFGTRKVWRGRERVDVSDPTRTIVDVLDDPSIGGGIRNVADILDEYLSGEHRDDKLLISYADQLGNRTVFKRLGYLLEALGSDASDLIETSLARRSAGLAKLDPSIDSAGRITKRWGLRVNAQIRTVASA